MQAHPHCPSRHPSPKPVIPSQLLPPPIHPPPSYVAVVQHQAACPCPHIGQAEQHGQAVRTQVPHRVRRLVKHHLGGGAGGAGTAQRVQGPMAGLFHLLPHQLHGRGARCSDNTTVQAKATCLKSSCLSPSASQPAPFHHSLEALQTPTAGKLGWCVGVWL